MSAVVDDTFIHDFNVLKSPVNNPVIFKNTLSNEQHESITKNKAIILEKAKSHILDLDRLNRLSKEHQNNPIMGYLNINNLCNKIFRTTQIYVLCTNIRIMH